MSEPKSEFLFMTCQSKGRVPFIVKGPQHKPVRLLRTKFDALKTMGYEVTEVEDPQGAFGKQPRPVEAAVEVEEITPPAEENDVDGVDDTTPPVEDTTPPVEDITPPVEDDGDSEPASDETVVDPAPETTGTEENPEGEVITEADGTTVEEHVMTREVLEELSKDKLKELMTSNEIEFAYSDTKPVLIQAILDFQEG